MTLGNILHARLASGRIYFQPDPSISCQGCSPNAPFAKLEMLTAESA
jgi:hypothetical protein